MDTIDPEEFQNDPLNLASLPNFEEVGLTGVSPKYLIKRILAIALSAFLMLGILLGIQFFIPEVLEGYGVWIFSAIIALTLWRCIFAALWQKRCGYALRERDVIFRRGVLVEKTTIVSFNRVQHVSTSRDALDKLLGLSRLQIFTAGGSGSDISVPGLQPEMAEKLKEAVSFRISGYA